jgi:hypothetical protein
VTRQHPKVLIDNRRHAMRPGDLQVDRPHHRARAFIRCGRRPVYVTYVVEMTGFDDFRKCNKSSTITRLEWVLGFRPVEDCRRL